jgi:carbamoyl-phosphate synthase large subunit
MNILITNVGNKNFLVKEFKKSLSKVFSKNSKVYASDNNLNASAIKFSDFAIKSPKYDKINFGKWLINIVETKKIKLIIPTNSYEIEYIEKKRTLLEKKYNCKVLGTPIKNIKRINNKLKLYTFLKKNKIKTPYSQSLSIFLKKKVKKFPFVIKKVYGQSSDGVFIIKKIQDWKNFLGYKKNNHKYFYQDYIKGDEFGIDIINDYKRKLIGVLVRKKIMMKNGETKKAKILSSKAFLSLAKKISKTVNHIGLIDIDAIKKNKDIYIIDINCRFGGGYKLSHAAGSNIPELLIKILKNQKYSKKNF